MICLGITVTLRATDLNLFYVFSQLFCVFFQFLIVVLFPGFSVAPAMDKRLRVNLAPESVSVKNHFQTLRSIFRVRLDLQPGISQILIDLVQQLGNLCKQPVSEFFCTSFSRPRCICLRSLQILSRLYRDVPDPRRLPFGCTP